MAALTQFSTCLQIYFSDTLNLWLKKIHCIFPREEETPNKIVLRTKGFLFLKNIINQSTQNDTSIVDKLRTLDTGYFKSIEGTVVEGLLLDVLLAI